MKFQIQQEGHPPITIDADKNFNIYKLRQEVLNDPQCSSVTQMKDHSFKFNYQVLPGIKIRVTYTLIP